VGSLSLDAGLLPAPAQYTHRLLGMSSTDTEGVPLRAAQVTHSVVDRPVIDRTSEPISRFYTDARMSIWPVTLASGPPGRFGSQRLRRVLSTQVPGRGGVVGNVATVLRELTLDADNLAEQTSQRSRAATR